jgi:nitrite reductase/ring-hydroxylating ferredoxin subunit/DMSO/TMAO reductase YedYZ heme-binding membrane subunit
MTFTPKWKVDLGLAALVVVWFTVGRRLFPGPDLPVFLVRASAMLAFLLLSAVLSLGPLARLWPAAGRLIYHRRHVGVTTWALGTFHAGLVMHYAVGWDPRGLLDAVPEEKFVGVPFPIFGALALVVLTAMALTSWDQILHAFGPPRWKRLHMLVYVAYGLLAIHVLTRLASDKGPMPLGLGLPFFTVVGSVAGLHLAAALKEAWADRPAPMEDSGLVRLGRFSDLGEGEATTVTAGDERIAVCRLSGQLHAISNVCPHQNGPLGEGRVRDGYLECPWHGYQFDPRTGQSPPGFTDFVPAFEIVTIDGTTYLKPPG